MEQKIVVYTDSDEAYDEVIAALENCTRNSTEIFWDVPSSWTKEEDIE